MNQANVKATDAIESVKAALAAFAKQSTDGLSEIDAEIRRTIEWIEHDRPKYWKERVRRAADAVGQAKAELHRCLSYAPSFQDRPSCSEQRAALKKAQAQLAYCEEKQERVRHWAREMGHEMHEYQGRVTSFSTVLESDVPAAMAALEQMLTTIEKYTGGAGTTGPTADD